jgi:cytochrome c553
MKKLIILVIGLLLVALFSGFTGCNQHGTAWAPGSFSSNGEKIYFSASSERGTRITSSGGPSSGMMSQGILACASCHGTDAKGGKHVMHMQSMDAPNIRWSKLGHEEGKEHSENEEGEEHSENEEKGHSEEPSEYDMNDFKTAVRDGRHPDGKQLKQDMPRWNIGDEDMKDLANYLKSLP